MSQVDPGLTRGEDPWYGPTDLQVVTSIQSLGLDIFPFGAYDPYGRLKVDPSVVEQLKRELKDVLSQPVWKDFFQVLSLLDNPGYDATATGFRATKNGVKVLVFKQLSWSSAPRGCATLQDSIALNLLPQLREYAGRRYAVQPRWLEVVREVLALLSGGLAEDELFGVPGEGDEDAEVAQVAAAIGWKAALQIVLNLLEIANKIGLSQHVNATVVWGYPGFRKLTVEETRKWSPISTVANHGAGACTGVLWDKAGRTIWHWAQAVPWPAGFPFTIAQIQASLYPSGFSRDVPEVADLEETSISSAGLRFIGHWEGFRGHLYDDPAGHCTIGYGHLVHRGNCNGSEPARFKKGISAADGLDLLRADAAAAAAGVNRLVRVPLNQHQFDALASFTFNLGAGALQESTLLAKLNRREYKEVPGEMMKWVKGGGKTLPGLVSRRRAEGALFSQGRYLD